MDQETYRERTDKERGRECVFVCMEERECVWKRVYERMKREKERK